MSERLRLVVFGMMGRTPFAGVAWQVLHYVEGLRRLGHDLYYVEDTGDWPYDPEQNTVTDDPRYTVSYINRLMSWCGMEDRWAYVAAAEGGQTYGVSAGRLRELLHSADALLNLTGSTLLHDEHLSVPVRIYVETDPVLPQIEVVQGRRFTIELMQAHTHHFTYGENLGAADCGVPPTDFGYRPTRQPIVLDWWQDENGAHPEAYTTIASWKQSGKDIEWNGEVYTWSKHHEFMKFLDLPARVRHPCELALACGDPEAIRLLASHHWWVTDALRLSRDIVPYRDFVFRSRAEFTVAKDQNIRLRSGWFSDRSACYLASGRPVVTQDTGFGNILPVGEGLFSFGTLDQAVAAFQAIESDYARQSQAARELAEGYFRAEIVLGQLLSQAGF